MFFQNWENPPVRCEVRRSWRKPWPQKGTGRARHGTRKTVIWQGGEVKRANRAPETSFYMLKFFKRVEGLRSTLSAKLIQVCRGGRGANGGFFRGLLIYRFDVGRTI